MSSISCWKQEMRQACRDSRGLELGVQGTAIPPLGPAYLPAVCPPWASPIHSPPPPRPPDQPHLLGVGGVVQQRHIHTLHSVRAVAIGAPEPVYLILPGVPGLSSTKPPSPTGPRAEWGHRDWGLRSLPHPLGGCRTSRMLIVVSVPGRMLKPRCSRKGVWSHL